MTQISNPSHRLVGLFASILFLGVFAVDLQITGQDFSSSAETVARRLARQGFISPRAKFEERLKQANELVGPDRLVGNTNFLSSPVNTQLPVGRTAESLAACTTTPISFGTPISGSLVTTDCFGSNRYFDQYTFTGTAGQTIRVNLSASSFDTLINVLDPSNNFISIVGAGSGSHNTQADVTLPVNGTYLIYATSLNQLVSNVSYTIALNRTFSISGRVALSSGTGVSGVLVTLSGNDFKQTTTDGNGNYSFTNLLSGGFYSLTPSSSGFLFTPSNQFFSSLTSNQTNVNFTATPTVTLSGRLKNVNGNPIDCFTGGGQQAPLSPEGNGPCQFPIDVTCQNGFSNTFFVTSVFSIQVPQQNGTCTLTPRTVGANGVTLWSPSFITVSAAVSQANINFAAAAPSFTIVGTIDPDASSTSVQLTLLPDGTQVPNGCSINTATRNYTCGVIIFGDYRITPTSAFYTFNPIPREYRAVQSTITGQNYTGTSVNNPTPVITSLARTTATAGEPGFTLTVNGTGFFESSVVRWNGQNRTTSVLSATQLAAQITADDLRNPGNNSVTVFNPSPGGGTSNSVTFTVNSALRAVPFDFDGDRKADLVVRRPSSNVWYLLRTSLGFTGVGFGLSGDLPAPADYDGDGKTDIGVFRPSTGEWFYLGSQNQTFVTLGWGMNGDLPVPADYDGDRKADLAVFRPSNATWHRQLSANRAIAVTSFGIPGDKPRIGDFDGDGLADLAVMRPSDNYWYFLRSTAGFTGFQWGLNGDIAAPADFDGDGKTDAAVFRPSTGTWHVVGSQLSIFSQRWGQAGDIPVPADYDGDGRADFAVFRPSNGNWYVFTSASGIFQTQLGINGDLPAQGSFAY